MENIEKYIKRYVSLNTENINDVLPNFSVRIEGRTNNDNMTEALRMRPHDPLWMLSRQMQMGEFRGNDAGSAMSVKCTIIEDDCQKDPLEPIVEQINPQIDIMARVESAVSFVDILRHSGIDREAVKNFIASAISKWPVDWAQNYHSLGHENTNCFEDTLNTRHTAYIQTYKGKIFDGFKLYQAIINNKCSASDIILSPDSDPVKSFIKWFNKKYLPTQESSKSWQQRDLCYSLSSQAGNNKLKGDTYNGGRLSWYSMDFDGESKTVNTRPRTVMSLPTPAQFSAAPNRRLWEIEDRRVYMGNSMQQQSSGNIAMMKYATMFSNDWMLFPLDTEIGKYIQINSLQVVDTFGDSITISGKDRAGKKDTEGLWQIFTNCNHSNPKVTQMDGLYYAPQLASTIEGKPIEEVKFLRDEMSNMVWGVEEIVSDGCGSTIDTKLRAAKLSEFVGDLYEQSTPKSSPQTVMFTNGESPIVKNESDKPAFRYLLQSTVPFNWIPLVPQRLKGDVKYAPFMLGGREIILRRGKMPCYIWNCENGKSEVDRIAVRPLGTILRSGIENVNGKYAESPLFFNEEAIQSTGIRVVKNYQRARWINGATYNWLGIYKRLAKTNSMSGLKFDVLEENK